MYCTNLSFMFNVHSATYKEIHISGTSNGAAIVMFHFTTPGLMIMSITELLLLLVSLQMTAFVMIFHIVC